MNKVQLPFGMKDYLPDECYNKQCAESEMGNVFSSYGYKRVAMPALEYCDLFTADGSIPVNKLFKLTDTDGSLLALRGDATIQVCRMYVTSMTGLQRMYYSLDSFEYLRDTNSSRDREFAQTGIELIGESGEDGEVEVLSMAVDALRAAGLENFKIELGHVGFFEGLAESVGLDPASAAELKSIINKKDMLGVELFFSDRGLGDDAKEGILSLPSLFGDASVLERAAGMCDNEKSRSAIARLSSLLGRLDSAGLGKYFSVDLGIVSCNDYYTGIVFKGICEGVGSSILDGGRYDNLCDRMGRHSDAVGFGIGMRRLLTALKAAGKWSKAPVADAAYAVIDCDGDVVRRTVSELRKTERVVQIFGGKDELIRYCASRGIKRALLFDGKPVALDLDGGAE